MKTAIHFDCNFFHSWPFVCSQLKRFPSRNVNVICFGLVLAGRTNLLA
ncbi:hypothetical protein M5D96_007554 [Drosophila gunungcola]|uniref:Uncharacterized protein n=1 Tax=Drosophila gunungcola TaxID=103775 RepID=A0A9P9YPA4_9MUSC|nr:hypothetical protein M5D96_007554 [Drosophila gunungcola]